ncbi:MAG: hypothetical protein L0Z50_02890 [Verrucomicrobiales bacterium]|nr:hypothetical protein [Verrucomicrobiales bacterium]
MGILSFLGRSSTVTLRRLPAGSFTIDRAGRILASTLPQSFPATVLQEVGESVLSTFRSAEAAHLPLSEVVAEYAALKLTARELRGGAIVFLTPRGLTTK